jgi:hypothetical protein
MKMSNSVAHTQSIFNDNLETKPRGKGGRPRKQASVPFVGFTQESIGNEYFRVPAIFLSLCAMIDNLAELKVVLYIMRHTWGFREYDAPKRITIDEFVHGRKRVDGSRMDLGTGLSERAVLQGLRRAIEHGIIVCYVDDRDQARVKHYYQLAMQSEEAAGTEPEFEEQTTYTDQQEQGYPTTQSEADEEAYTDLPMEEYTEQEEEYDPYAGTVFSPNYQPQEQKIFASETCTTISADLNNNQSRPAQQLARSENRTEEQTLRTNDIRNVHPSEKFEESIRFLPKEDQLPKPKAKSPAFIRNMITDFSRDLGDHDHIFSNISHATRLYRNCGATEEAFMQALYDARALAKKATQIRHLNSFGNPNRMPYFFRCLNAALKQEAAV